MSYYLLLIPFLTSVGLGVSGVAQLLVEKQKLLTHCRITEMKYQDRLSFELNELLKLNPQAQSLRRQRRIAQRAFLNAMKTALPPVIAVAKLNLARVISAQMILRSKQEAHFAAVKLLNLKKRNDVYKKEKLFLGELSFSSTPLRLEVEPQPFDSLTPSYLESKWLSESSTRSDWRLSVQVEFIKPFFEWTQISLSESCVSGLFKEKKKWKARLKKAKL